MTKLYMHEFVFTAMDRDNPNPIKSVTVILVSEDKDENSLLASGFAQEFFDQNLNVTHRILMEGARMDGDK